MKKAVAILLLLILLLGSVCSCAKVDSYSRSFFLMDTTITVTLYSSDAALAARELEYCHGFLEELDQLWSRHAKGGDISRINASQNGISDADPRTVALIKQALEISAATNGAFDITLTPLSELWEACSEKNRLPTQLELINALAFTGSRNLTVTDQAIDKPTGMKLDLGGIGKGAAVSLLISHLKSTALSGGLISFGSNVAVFGEKPNREPFRISLRDPKNPNQTVGSLPLNEHSVLSVSGDYERFVTIMGKNYHHILSPSTGKPAESGLSSVSVIASDGALADALSTACFVMGAEQTMALYRSGIYDFEAILITQSGELLTTDGLSGVFVPAAK